MAKESVKLPPGQNPPGGQKGGWTPKRQVDTSKGPRVIWERSAPTGHDGKKPKRRT